MITSPNFHSRLDAILNEEFDENYFAAVGVVQSGDRWLLGLAKNSGDDREGTWVCPGGVIKSKEDPKKAAVREVWEETGIRCTAAGKAFTLPLSLNKKGVAFVHCKARAGQKFHKNHEFAAIGFFTMEEMKSLKLYKNVLPLIKKIKRAN